MNAKEWIQSILDHPDWSKVDIEWEAVDQIDEIINRGPDLRQMGQLALLGGLTPADVQVLVELKHRGFMPFLRKIMTENMTPHHLKERPIEK